MRRTSGTRRVRCRPYHDCVDRSHTENEVAEALLLTCPGLDTADYLAMARAAIASYKALQLEDMVRAVRCLEP